MRHCSTLFFLMASVPLAAQPVPPVPLTPARPAQAPPAPQAPRKAVAAPRPLTPLPLEWDAWTRDAQLRARELQERSMERALTARFELGQRGVIAPVPPFREYHPPEHPPAPWAQGDPADSLYKAAYTALNRGDYRRAAAMFKEIPQRFQYSRYAADAMYWQAHALYRVGNTPELQEALAVLEALKQKYPGAQVRSSQRDVGELAVRIAGTLASRGLGGQEVVRRTLAERGETCDREETDVRAQALSALMETDPESAAQLAQKILSRKDECSVQLRRNAVMITARKRDAQTVATLASVAKSDPSSEVRQSAVRYLAGMSGDDALAALEDLLKSSDDQNVQREAVRALVTHSSPRARQAARAIIERNDAAEAIRVSALRAFDRDRSTTEDATWLRNIYPKVDNARVKAEIVQSITRIGGDGMDQWFLALARNEDESLEARNSAIRRAAQTMDIVGLGRFYDQVAQRQLRETVISALGERREPETIDKLVDIAKNGTDPALRRTAISALTRKKDPRANKALLDLIDKPDKP